MSDTDRLAALLSEVIALDCLPFEATHGPDCLLARIQDALPAAGVTLAPAPPDALEWKIEHVPGAPPAAFRKVRRSNDPVTAPLDPTPPDALDVAALAEAIDKHRREWPQIEYHRCTALCAVEIAREYAPTEEPA